MESFLIQRAKDLLMRIPMAQELVTIAPNNQDKRYICSFKMKILSNQYTWTNYQLLQLLKQSKSLKKKLDFKMDQLQGLWIDIINFVKNSNVLVCQLPSTDETYHILDMKIFDLMYADFSLKKT